MLKAERHHCPQDSHEPIFQPHAALADDPSATFPGIRIRVSSTERSEGEEELSRISPADLDPLLAYELLFGNLMEPSSEGGAIIKVDPRGMVPPLGTVEELLVWATRSRGADLLISLEGLRGKPSSKSFPLTLFALLAVDGRMANEATDPFSAFFEDGRLERYLDRATGFAVDAYPLRDLENAIFVLEHLRTFMASIPPPRLDPLLEKLKEVRARLHPS